MATRYPRIGMHTRKPSPKNSREKPLQRPKSCRKRWTTVLKSTLRKKPWDHKRRRVRRRTDHRTTSRNPSPTNQPQRAVPTYFSRRSYTRQGPMAHPAPRRARIGTTDIPGTRISDHGSSKHSSERRCSPYCLSSDHRRPSSSSGRCSDRGRERNSTSRAATPTNSRRHDSTGQQGSSARSRTEGRDSGSTAQPASSSLSRHETTSRANLSGHPGLSQQASERDRRGSMDHPVALSMPTRRGLTTDRSRSSSNDEIRIIHVSEKSTESVAPADVTSHADGSVEVANPAQLADSAQFADTANTASPSEAADPARTADSAGEPEFTCEEQPCWPGTAESAGPARMDGPSQQQPAARADPAGITDPFQDQSAVGPSSVSRPRLMPGFDH